MNKRSISKSDHHRRFGQQEEEALVEALLITAFLTIALISAFAILLL